MLLPVFHCIVFYPVATKSYSLFFAQASIIEDHVAAVADVTVAVAAHAFSSSSLLSFIFTRTFIIGHHAVVTEGDEVAQTTTPLGGMNNNNVSSARFRKIKASRLSACSDTFLITDRGHLDESLCIS